jgi:hypothetical protein
LRQRIRHFCRVRAFLSEGRASIADDEKEIQCEDSDEVGEKSQHSDYRYPDVLGAFIIEEENGRGKDRLALVSPPAMLGPLAADP